MPTWVRETFGCFSNPRLKILTKSIWWPQRDSNPCLSPAAPRGRPIQVLDTAHAGATVAAGNPGWAEGRGVFPSRGRRPGKARRRGSTEPPHTGRPAPRNAEHGLPTTRGSAYG